MNSTTRTLLAASVAGLVAAVGLGTIGQAHAAQAGAAEKVPCYGVNKCKGNGECGSKAKGNSCAGKNECAGKGFLKIDKETCLKIQGGRLTEES